MSNIIIITQTEFLKGVQGTSGNVILNGSGAPIDGLGKIGDYYLNTDNGEAYGPKSINGWGIAQSSISLGLTGAGGPRGIAGPRGEQGPPIDLCHQPDTCDFGTADCNAPLAVSIDQRISRHLTTLFDNFNSCSVVTPTIDNCVHPHLIDTFESFNGFFEALLDRIRCGDHGPSCKLSMAVETKINSYIDDLISISVCGGGSPSSCVADPTLIQNLSTHLRSFIETQIMIRGVTAANSTINGLINGICSGSFDDTVFTDTCLTQDERTSFIQSGNDLFNKLLGYSANLSTALAGGGSCQPINDFLSSVISGGISISAAGGVGVKLSTEGFEINQNGCVAKIGLDNIALECNGNSLSANTSEIVLTLDTGAYTSLKPSGFEVADANGNFIKAYPSSITIQNDQGTSVVVSPDSIEATSDAGGSASINSNGDLAITTSGENTIEFNDTELNIHHSNSDIIVDSNGVDVSVGAVEVKISSSHLQVTNSDVSVEVGSSGLTAIKGSTTTSVNENGVEVKKDTITTSIGGKGLKYTDSSNSTSITLAHDGLSATTPAGSIFITANPSQEQPTLGISMFDTNGNQCQLFPQDITIKDDNSGETVVIDVPEKGGDGDKISAYWHEIDICVGGVAKKAMVMMTAPYDP